MQSSWTSKWPIGLLRKEAHKLYRSQSASQSNLQSTQELFCCILLCQGTMLRCWDSPELPPTMRCRS